MAKPTTIALYSEKGGVAKTTSTVGIAASFASRGLRVGVVDLDPQATASKWFDVEPKGEGLHVGAILADEEPDGWAGELAVRASWKSPAGIWIVPSAKAVANRERAAVGDVGVEGRLRASLEDWDVDVVLLDVPNRQGGPLVQNALTAADAIVVPVTLDEDGLESVDRTRENVTKFRKTPWNPRIHIAGFIATLVPIGIPSREVKRTRKALKDEPEDVLASVPNLTVVREARAARDWWGNYSKGEKPAAAYDEVAVRLIESFPRLAGRTEAQRAR